MHWILIAFLFSSWSSGLTPPIAVASYDRQVDCENAAHKLGDEDTYGKYICANEFIGKVCDVPKKLIT